MSNHAACLERARIKYIDCEPGSATMVLIGAEWTGHVHGGDVHPIVEWSGTRLWRYVPTGEHWIDPATGRQLAVAVLEGLA